jgi:RNA polymerase sigma-70 factor (ECF subfamily)
MMSQPVSTKPLQAAPAADAASPDRREVPSGRIAGDDPRIAQAAAGERQAASELARELLPRVRNLVRYLVAGDADVDDHAQAALIEVLRALPGFRGDSALTTWADRITVRETLRRVKRRRTHQARLRELHLEPVPEPAPSPGERYAARRRVAEMLDALPEAQREALVLHHVAGMSVPELAETLNIPFDTAKSRLRLAIGRLRQLYGEDDG